jgi:uncharacterized membrane protein
MTKTRLEAFSDGVIAIVITIMVLELKAPHSMDGEVIKHLLPPFVSYVLSFAIIGIYWGNHHHLLHTATHVNSKIIWANLHLLFWLSLVPFCTAWMGETNFHRTTVAIYAALLEACGFAYYILLKTIENSHSKNVALRETLEKQSRKGIKSQIAYSIAILTAFVHPIISGLLFFLVAVMWWIPDRNIEKSTANNTSDMT